MLKLTIIDIKVGKIKLKKLTQFEFVLKENSWVYMTVILYIRGKILKKIKIKSKYTGLHKR